MAIRARIVSVGTALPEKIVGNDHFATYLDTSDEWIVRRTGIKQRRFVDDPKSPTATSDLGSIAAKNAIDKAGIDPATIDAVICATFSPDNFFPSTACAISNKVGASKSFAFDISAACAGFVYGLTIANSLILSGQCKTVLLVGAEVVSRTLDFNDRSTCILFGDGAGAIVLRGEEGERGILSCECFSDGSLGDILKLPVPWNGSPSMFMNGTEVFKNAVRLMTDVTRKAICSARLEFADINLLVPHQANIRIIQAMGEYLGLSEDRVVVNVERFGNTSAASIPIALAEAWDSGRISEGDLVVFAGLGGGLTVGGAVARF